MEEHGEFDCRELPTLGKASFTEEQVLGDWSPRRRRDSVETMMRTGATFPDLAPILTR
jgi:hypothetical protein